MHEQLTRQVRDHGLRPCQVASVLGLRPAAVRDRMTGRIRWSLADAVALADHLGVTVDELVKR